MTRPHLTLGTSDSSCGACMYCRLLNCEACSSFGYGILFDQELGLTQPSTESIFARAVYSSSHNHGVPVMHCIVQALSSFIELCSPATSQCFACARGMDKRGRKHCTRVSMVNLSLTSLFLLKTSRASFRM